jgi:hypothetical protein
MKYVVTDVITTDKLWFEEIEQKYLRDQKGCSLR